MPPPLPAPNCSFFFLVSYTQWTLSSISCVSLSSGHLWIYPSINYSAEYSSLETVILDNFVKIPFPSPWPRTCLHGSCLQLWSQTCPPHLVYHYLRTTVWINLSPSIINSSIKKLYYYTILLRCIPKKALFPIPFPFPMNNFCRVP